MTENDRRNKEKKQDYSMEEKCQAWINFFSHNANLSSHCAEEVVTFICHKIKFFLRNL